MGSESSSSSLPQVDQLSRQLDDDSDDDYQVMLNTNILKGQVQGTFFSLFGGDRFGTCNILDWIGDVMELWPVCPYRLTAGPGFESPSWASS